MVILALGAGLLNLGTPSRLGRCIIVAGVIAQVLIIWTMPPATESFRTWWQHVT